MQTPQLYSDVIVWLIEKDEVLILDRRDSTVNTDGEWVKTLPVEVLKTSLILKVALKYFVFLKKKLQVILENKNQSTLFSAWLAVSLYL